MNYTHIHHPIQLIYSGVTYLEAVMDIYINDMMMTKSQGDKDIPDHILDRVLFHNTNQLSNYEKYNGKTKSL